MSPINQLSPSEPVEFEPGRQLMPHRAGNLRNSLGILDGTYKRVHGLFPSRYAVATAAYDQYRFQIGQEINGTDYYNLGAYLLDEEIGTDDDGVAISILIHGMSPAANGATSDVRFRVALVTLPEDGGGGLATEIDVAYSPGSAAADFHQVPNLTGDVMNIINLIPNRMEGRITEADAAMLSVYTLDGGALPDFSLVSDWPCILQVAGRGRGPTTRAYVYAVLMVGAETYHGS